MSTLRSVIEDLQESGLVVQGLTLQQIEEVLRNDRRPPKDQFTALMAQGRAYGIYLYQDQVRFDQPEFARKLGEIGFDHEDAMRVISNLRQKPTPELASLGGRD
jgi:hypothetical protein